MKSIWFGLFSFWIKIPSFNYYIYYIRKLSFLFIYLEIPSLFIMQCKKETLKITKNGTMIRTIHSSNLGIWSTISNLVIGPVLTQLVRKIWRLRSKISEGVRLQNIVQSWRKIWAANSEGEMESFVRMMHLRRYEGLADDDNRVDQTDVSKVEEIILFNTPE